MQPQAHCVLKQISPLLSLQAVLVMLGVPLPPPGQTLAMRHHHRAEHRQWNLLGGQRRRKRRKESSQQKQITTRELCEQTARGTPLQGLHSTAPKPSGSSSHQGLSCSGQC